MSDDIVTRLQCIYDRDGCGQCTFCLAKAEIERLRAEVEHEREQSDQWAKTLDAIDALHQPDQRIYCSACCDRWPCRTARLLHPEEADRG